MIALILLPLIPFMICGAIVYAVDHLPRHDAPAVQRAPLALILRRYGLG